MADHNKPNVVADTESSYGFEINPGTPSTVTLQFGFSGRDQGRNGCVHLSVSLASSPGETITPDKYKKVVQEYLDFVLDELSRPLVGQSSTAVQKLDYRDWADARDWEILIRAGLDQATTRLYKEWVEDKPDREQAVRRLAFFRQVTLSRVRARDMERRLYQ
ncbi:MAG: hypothetical protein ACJAVZ_004532 [Afipia broomeae]|jgi:hypothetical protein|nr:MAG: hypothetical protein EKK35_14085 [Bradyrhizobiaceae bacterium]